MQYLALLFACCLAGYVGVNAVIFKWGYEPIWHVDGIFLYLNFFMYEGEAIRGLVGSVVSGAGFSWPSYSLDLGYGADVYTTMGGMLNDPINLLSALCPATYSEYLFVFLIFLRVFLAAVTFSYYCFQKNNGRGATLIASLCYAFCGFTIFWAMFRHPNFLNTPLLLPLLLAGVDKLFEKRNPTLFIVALTLQLTVSVYFTFMSGCMVFAYCLVKFCFLQSERTLRRFASLVGQTIASVVLALAMAAVFVIPIILVLTSLGRVSAERAVSFLQDFSSYASYPSGLVAGTGSLRTAFIGSVPTISVLAFLLCGKHFDRHTRRPWLVGLAIAMLLWISPYLTHIVNGFSYSTDRWIYGLVFCTSYIACLTIPRLREFGKSEWLRVFIATAVYAVGAWALIDFDRNLAVVLCLASMMVAILLMRVAGTGKYRKFGQGALAVTVIACASIVGSVFCSSYGTEHVYAMTRIHDGYQRIVPGNPLKVAAEIDDESVYRVSRDDMYKLRNAGLSTQVMGIDFYSSFYNQCVDDFRTSLGIADNSTNFIYSGQDARCVLDLALGSKYYVANPKEPWRTPWSFNGTGAEANGYQLAETSHASPLAFASETYIPAQVYWNTAIEKRQELLAESTILETEPSASTPSAEPAPHITTCEYEIIPRDGAKLEDGKIVTEKKEAEVVVRFDGNPSSENYLVFDNLSFTPSDTDHGVYTLTVASGERTRTLDCYAPSSAGYSGRANWVFNLGYSDEALTEYTVSFSDVGAYAFDDMRVAQQPVEPLAELFAQRQKAALSDLELKDGSISATIDSSKAGSLAVFTVAYSPGWSATVDGKPADVLKADIAFMAVQVPDDGTHDIRLTYETPGARIGLMLSIAGWAAFAGLLFYLRKKRQPAEDMPVSR